mgnify:CR=1 FL=1
MMVVTKDCISYDCKFISNDGDTITLTLWDNKIEIIKTNDLDYISPS